MKLRLTRRGLLRWCWMRALLLKLHVRLNSSQCLKVKKKYIYSFIHLLNGYNCLIRHDCLPGPGTSLRLPGTSQGGGPTPAVRYFLLNFTIDDIFNTVRNAWSEFSFLKSRPMTQSGRPITGFVRPSTQSGRPGTMEQAIKTPRTASTARPVTSASGRFIRLGTVSKYVWNWVSLQRLRGSMWNTIILFPPELVYLKHRICPVNYRFYYFHGDICASLI